MDESGKIRTRLGNILEQKVVAVAWDAFAIPPRNSNQ
jgi:uncharacterized RmlC-like cupin family protein